MSRIKFFILLFALTGFIIAQGLQPVGAQRRGKKAGRGIELGGFYGYQFGGGFTVYQGDVNIIDTGNYGFFIALPLPVGRGKQLEFNYTRQDTRLELKYYQGNPDEGILPGQKVSITDLLVEYYQIGGVNQFITPGSNLVPYGMFTLGATRFHPKNSSYTEDKWMFAVTLGGGVKIFVREKIGLRLQGRLLLPINWGGAGIWFGSGGPQVGVSGGSSVLQGDLSAGLFFVL
jgi:opacity protein-like surface antigen